MKYLTEEFFGCRLYDSETMTENYYDKKQTKEVLKLPDLAVIEHEPTADLSSPLKISFNITKKCNIQCKHCFMSANAHAEDGELTTEELYKLFDDMQRHGTFFICIGGGEPLIRPDIFRVLNYARDNDIAVSLVSNGLLITEGVAKKLNNLDTIWISFDGLEKNHDNIRGKGTFKKTVENIKILRKYCKGKIAMRNSVNSQNLSDIEGLIRLAERLKVDAIRFTPMLLAGRATSHRELLMSQDQYIKFLADIEKMESDVQIIHPNTVHSKKFWVNPDDFGCHCGKEASWIMQTGEYSPCIFYGEDYNVGNIKDEDYIELWKKSIERGHVCGNMTCKTCSNYKRCRGGCRARALWEYGDIDDVDPLCPLRRNTRGGDMT